LNFVIRLKSRTNCEPSLYNVNTFFKSLNHVVFFQIGESGGLINVEEQRHTMHGQPEIEQRYNVNKAKVQAIW
jgi:hypothetical protein